MVLIARLLFIQFFKSSYLKELAQRQHKVGIDIEPRRGGIYDRARRSLAVNIPMDSLYAVPNRIKDKDQLIAKLSPILGLSKNYLRDRIYRDKSFVWLSRKLSPVLVGQIKQLGSRQLGFIKESRRSYPNTYLASHVIGFAGLDNSGLEGVEVQYNDYLKGTPGLAMFLRDARGNKLDIWEEVLFPKDGYDLVLTIDEVIQYIAERELDKAFRLNSAKQAGIIVINPHTGEILALANRPNFDLNYASKVKADLRRNRAITDIFEPGSSFKIVATAAALEEGIVSEDDTFFCENGKYKIGNHILHDHHPHGTLTFNEVIEQSSNIGIAKVAQALGPEVLYRYIKLFGFGAKLGIDLPGEISGMIKKPRQWSKTSIGIIPMGHEVGVTLLQMASAISVIANGGLLMRPYILKEVRDKYDQEIKKFPAVLIRKVISSDTANRVKEILVGVVERGTGHRAAIPGYKVAGKTGTAQKIGPDGKYSHKKFMAVFVGFAPADDPAIAIVVIVDEPSPIHFGGVVCAPVFSKVAADVLKYMGIKER